MSEVWIKGGRGEVWLAEERNGIENSWRMNWTVRVLSRELAWMVESREVIGRKGISQASSTDA